MYKRLQKISLSCLIGLIFSCASVDKVNSNNSHAADDKNYYLTRCLVLNNKFEIVKHLSNAKICALTLDGGWVGVSSTGLDRLDKNGIKLWSVPGIFHHQIKIHQNKYVYALYSIVKIIENKKVFFDGVYKIDLKTGDILNNFSGYEQFYLSKDKSLSYFNLRNMQKEGFLKFAVTEVDLLNTHLNSIDIIGDEILVSDYGYLTFTLTLDLNFKEFNHEFYETFKSEKILPQNAYSQKHDLQLLPNGNFLVFKNFKLINKSITYKIYEYKDSKIQFEFPTKTEDFHLVARAGTVEKLADDQYLIGYPINKKSTSFVGVVSKNGEWTQKAELPFLIQDIKKISKEYLINLKDSFFEK